jgi:hypothetical protein
MKETHHVICECHSPDHVLQFSHMEDMDGDEICWTQVQLHQHRSFWERLVVAVKYLFGYECRYGHWDCTSINVEQGKFLRDYLNRAIEAKENSGTN